MVAVAVVFTVGNAFAQNAVVPGEVRVDATFQHVGVVWWIGGDDDLDSTMVAEFRRMGDPTWRPAAPAMRAHPALIVNGEPLGLNSWAASAMFLTPGADYELRLTLEDPDGGGEVRVVEGSTRQELPAFYSGRTTARCARQWWWDGNCGRSLPRLAGCGRRRGGGRCLRGGSGQLRALPGAGKWHRGGTHRVPRAGGWLGRRRWGWNRQRSGDRRQV